MSLRNQGEYQCLQRYLKSLDDPTNDLSAMLHRVAEENDICPGLCIPYGQACLCLDMSGTMSAFADACAVLVVMLPLDRMGSAKKFGVMDLALKVPSGRVHGILLVKPTV